MKRKALMAAIGIAGALACGLQAQAQEKAPQLRADNIEEVIKAMTLEEKAQLLTGGGNDGFTGSGAMMGHQEKIVAGAAGITVAIPRLGIPATVMCDGPAGVHIDATRKNDSKTYYATGFPIGTCLASSWNTQLVEEVGKAIGNEVLEYGCDVILGPGMNLHRNPLGGRNFEYYSEDPILTGEMAAAYINGVQSQGVGTSPKHFAVNSQETYRTKVDEQLTQRALRELYLKGFEIMVKKSKPWTVMSAYNHINGEYCQKSYSLLTTILRDEWGFDGIVETDWIGKRNDLPTADEVKAGNDLLTPGYPAQVQDIIEGVKNKVISTEELDKCVRRVLQYIVRTPRFKGYKFSNKPNMKANAEITRQSSTEGMVLLKNDNVLPIRDLKTVALFGVCSYDFLSGGLGSGCVNVPYVVNMIEGLKNIGVTTTPTLTNIYQKYIEYAKAKLQADKNPRMWFLNQGQPKLEEIEITERCVQHEINEADAAIITIARQAGEGMDRSLSEFNLTQDEMNMLRRVSDAFRGAGKPVIVILNSGSVMETASWRDWADAILIAWQPGQEGGNSVADVLTGKANPSGKLTMTWPIACTDNPSTKNFPQEIDTYTLQDLQVWGRPVQGLDYSKHEEDIYVGYRYFDTFDRNVAYPFGYGLSYTTFEYSKPSVKVSGDNIQLTITVKNTGSTAGKEAVQVYVKAPAGKLKKPEHELKAFAKTKMLKPGESETLKMQVNKRDLASFDDTQSQWVAEDGKYTFQFAASSRDIRATAETNISGMTEKVNSVLKPTAKLNLIDN